VNSGPSDRLGFEAFPELILPAMQDPDYDDGLGLHSIEGHQVAYDEAAQICPESLRSLPENGCVASNSDRRVKSSSSLSAAVAFRSAT